VKGTGAIDVDRDYSGALLQRTVKREYKPASLTATPL
jgi:hypothetical protein